MYYILNFLLVLSAQLLSTGTVGAVECNLNLDVLKECGVDMSFVHSDPSKIAHNFVMPKEDKDILENCNRIRAGIDCFGQYIKCLDQFTRRMLFVVEKNGRKLLTQVCDSEATRREFLHHISCWNLERDFVRMNMCADKAIVQMESLEDVESPAQIAETIASGCCIFHMVRECIRTEGRRHCHRNESIMFIENIATTMSGSLEKLMCQKMQTLEECDLKLADTWLELKELVASDDPVVIHGMRKYSSPLHTVENMIRKFKKGMLS